MTSTSVNDQRQRDFAERLRGHNMAPLWPVLHQLVTPQPATRCEAAIWHYASVRPCIEESGELITAQEAERRVLILENPAMPGQARITPSLYAGLQLILPGEVAPAHRHTQSALRFVVEGEGAYTAVEGEKTIMRPGDFVITPNWSWHDHGNESDQAMVWLDGLDIPIVEFFGASFAQKHEAELQPQARPIGDSQARFGNGLLPVDQGRNASSSPVFNYPYSRTRESLLSLARTGEMHPCYGIKLKYTNPVTGDYAIPTMATFMQYLPADFRGDSYRSTDATVFSVVEGSGRTLIGDQQFHWRSRDTFVVPSWVKYRIESDEASTLFSFSDRGIQQKLGLWREQIGD